MLEPAREVLRRREDALFAQIEEEIDVVEREAPRHEDLRDVARALGEGDAEEVVDLGEPGEVGGVLRERRAALDDAATKDAHRIEIRLPRLDAEGEEVAVDVEERGAVFGHRDHVDALDEPAEALDRERVIEELGEDGEALLGARRPRPAGAQKGELRLRHPVLGGERVGLDLVDEQAVDLHRGERRARSDADALRAGDDLRGEILVEDDLDLEGRVLRGEAGLDSDRELFRADHRGFRFAFDPRAAPDAPAEVLREVEVARVGVERGRLRAAVLLERQLVEAARADREEHLVRLPIAIRYRAKIPEDRRVPGELLRQLGERGDVALRNASIDRVRRLGQRRSALREERVLGRTRPLDTVEDARLLRHVVEACRRAREEDVTSIGAHPDRSATGRRRSGSVVFAVR